MTSPLHDDDGLTLIEMMVAIFVISVVLMAMAGTAMTAMRSMQTSERVVRATQLGNEVLETYLARDFEELGLYADDVDATFGTGTTTYDGEGLVIFPQPTTPDYDRVPEAYQELERDGVMYEIRTAVVWTTDTDPMVTDQFKRVIVELAWDVRGDARTSSVEALVARDPAEQMLTVVVEPSTVAIDTSGVQQVDFTVTVTAKDPQSAVVVSWEDRAGAKQSGSLTDVDNGLVWTKTFQSHAFANGGTLFTVVGTLAGTTQKDVTTIGRALFLQPLELPASEILLVPEELSYHPESGYCESGVLIEAEAYGAIFSDPMAYVIDVTGFTDPLEYPMVAVEPPLTEGTLYRVELDLTDLAIQSGDTLVDGRLRVTRPTGETEITVERNLDIPIVVLPQTGTDDDGNPVYQSCP